MQLVAPTERMQEIREKVGSIPNRLKAMQKLISGLESGKSSHRGDADSAASARAGAASASASVAASPSGAASSRNIKAGGSPAAYKGTGKKTPSRPN